MSSPAYTWRRHPCLEQRCVDHGLTVQDVLMARLTDLEVFDQRMSQREEEEREAVARKTQEELELLHSAYTTEELMVPATRNDDRTQPVTFEHLPVTISALTALHRQPNGIMRLHEHLDRSATWLEQEAQQIQVLQRQVEQHLEIMHADELILLREELARRVSHTQSVRTKVIQMLQTLATLIQQRETLERTLRDKEFDVIKARTKKLRVLLMCFNARLQKDPSDPTSQLTNTRGILSSASSS
jgi:uncharacterized DUF497 family protein